MKDLYRQMAEALPADCTIACLRKLVGIAEAHATTEIVQVKTVISGTLTQLASQCAATDGVSSESKLRSVGASLTRAKADLYR